MNKSVMIVGVGGQGTLLASRILGDAMMDQGFDVKVSEVHGMSQRGGSVVTYVRYGDKVYSPVIETGEADVVLAFEQLEAARFLPYLKVGGTVVTSTQKIDPMPVVTGDKAYPQGILEEMEGKGVNVLAVDAMSLAEEAGSQKAVNVVLIGAMARRLGGDKELWLSAVERCVPPKFLEMNKPQKNSRRNTGRSWCSKTLSPSLPCRTAESTSTPPATPVWPGAAAVTCWRG